MCFLASLLAPRGWKTVVCGSLLVSCVRGDAGDPCGQAFFRPCRAGVVNSLVDVSLLFNYFTIYYITINLLFILLTLLSLAEEQHQ